MAIRDYRCSKCGFELLNQIEPISELPIHSCPTCTTNLTLLIASIAPPVSAENTAYVVKRERFDRRNKRIEGMTPKQQDGFKKIIDSTGGKRYIP